MIRPQFFLSLLCHLPYHFLLLSASCPLSSFAALTQAQFH